MINRFPGVVTDMAESPDKRSRSGNKWVAITIHHTDIGGRNPDDVDEALWRKLFKGVTSWLATADDTYASAHFHIGRFGECVQLVDPETHVAFHAGVSSFWHPIMRKFVSGWNEYSIGIELLGDGNRGIYSESQYQKCAELCAQLMKRYPEINPICINGHEVVAPGRKVDPGRYYDWQKFFAYLYKNLLA